MKTLYRLFFECSKDHCYNIIPTAIDINGIIFLKVQTLVRTKKVLQNLLNSSTQTGKFLRIFELKRKHEYFSSRQKKASNIKEIFEASSRLMILFIYQDTWHGHTIKKEILRTVKRICSKIDKKNINSYSLLKSNFFDLYCLWIENEDNINESLEYIYNYFWKGLLKTYHNRKFIENDCMIVMRVSELSIPNLL